MIRLFVFDLGNVILPFEHRQIGRQLWEKSEKQADLSPEGIFASLFGRADGLINPFEKGHMTSQAFFAQVKERFALALDLEAFKGIWNPIFRENERVTEAIRYLKAKGYPLFLLSDTNELHFTYIRDQYPIVGAFDQWILSYEVGAKKPEKRIYDEIFARMAVAPDEVFYTDDIAPYVEAARGFGIRGMVFKDGEALWQTLQELGA